MEATISGRYELATSYAKVERVGGRVSYFALKPNPDFDPSRPPSDLNPNAVEVEITEAEYEAANG